MKVFAVAVGFTLLGTVCWTSAVRGQPGLETPSAGLRDSSEAGGTRINTSPDKDSAPVTPDVTAASTESPQIRGQLQEDMAERQMLMQRRLEKDVQIPAGTVGSYDLSAGAAYGGDQWRFVYYNSHWWYWQPNNTWAVYYRNQWIPYNASTYNQYFANSRSPRGNILTRTPRPMAGGTATGAGGQIGPNFLPGGAQGRVQAGYRGNPGAMGGSGVGAPGAAGVGNPGMSRGPSENENTPIPSRGQSGIGTSQQPYGALGGTGTGQGNVGRAGEGGAGVGGGTIGASGAGGIGNSAAPGGSGAGIGAGAASGSTTGGAAARTGAAGSPGAVSGPAGSGGVGAGSGGGGAGASGGTGAGGGGR